MYANPRLLHSQAVKSWDISGASVFAVTFVATPIRSIRQRRIDQRRLIAMEPKHQLLPLMTTMITICSEPQATEALVIVLSTNIPRPNPAPNSEWSMAKHCCWPSLPRSIKGYLTCGFRNISLPCCCHHIVGHGYLVPNSFSKNYNIIILFKIRK